MKTVFSKISLATFAAVALSLTACKDKPTTPPDMSGYDPNLHVTHTIAQLVQESALSTHKIDNDTMVIAGIVVADDRSGNFYKKIVIEDALDTSANKSGITVNINAYSLYNDYPVGRKIYIKCKGLYVGQNAGLPELGGGLDEQQSLQGINGDQLDKVIVKANIGNPVVPVEVTLDEVANVNVQYLNRLIKIKDVEFIDAELGMRYTDPTKTTERKLKDCFNHTIITRNSNYANFNAITIPQGKGSFTCIYTCYVTPTRSTAQLVLRDTSDVKLNGARCDGSEPEPLTLLLNEAFSSLADWKAISVKGAQVWKIASYGNPRPCAVMTGYENGNFENEDWLISKQLDLNGFSKVTLTFETAAKYAGDPLVCYISDNYNGSNDPNASTWTEIPALYDESNNFVFTSSGNLDLSAYIGKKVYIAYRFTSSATQSKTWELDNVKVVGER